MHAPSLLKYATVLFFITTGLCGASWFGSDSQKIVIVQGTSSLSDATEKSQAAKLAKQIDLWLTQMGVPHKTLTDDEVSPWRLWRTRVVILPYNPHPSALELKAFQGVIRAGGILMVFYGMDNDLASLMEIKLGPYQAAKSKSQWTSFEFDRIASPALPERVFQPSQHLVGIFPDSGAARVIAYWLDARGARTPEAAWIQSKAGFWMSHILQPGDDENKRRMLLAMLATAIPGIWEQATEHLLAPDRPFGEFESLKSACLTLAQNQPSETQRGRDWTAYVAAQNWRAHLTRIYAQQYGANSGSLRGIWIDEGACPSPAVWPAIERSLERHKLNTVFFHVGNPLTLRSSAQLFPPPENASRRLDNTNSPAIHAWLSCMNLEGAAPEQLKPLRDQNRLQVSDTGETINWLCPSHPENRVLLARAAASLAQDKIFSGIHLDYIRYLNSHACYCPGCHQQFEQALGRPLDRWPKAALSGAIAPVFRAWRADQISACIKAISQTLHAANPELQISAAVYGATPACFTSVGQDWPHWLQENLVDFVCPMNYTPDLNTFQELLTSQSALPQASRIYPGVGISSSQSQLSPDQAAAQLVLIKNSGFAGFVLFEYHSSMKTSPLPYLP